MRKLQARLWPLALLLLLGGCGGATKTVTVTTASSTTSTASTASSSGSATPTTSSTTTSTPIPAVHFSTFKSPSANIGCMIIAGTARCDIRHRTWSPPSRPASCPRVVDYGQGVIVARSGSGRLVCAGDTALDPSARSVAYGTTTVVGAFRCQSQPAGVTCRNRDTGHGFFISSGSYRVF
jgi:hypothetical protein